MGRRRRREEGQALVEFALVLPVLLLILLAILKFGILFENYLTLTDAVRAGARTLAISRGVPVNTGVTPNTGPCQNATLQVEGSASSLNWAQSGATVSEQLNGGDNCTTPTLTSGNAATVTATYPCDTTILGINFLPNCKLNVSATERIE